MAAAVVIFLAILVVSFSDSDSDKPPSSQKDFAINIPNAGGLPPLDVVMKDNKNLRHAVEKIFDYDEAYLFVNYRQVNGEIANILFMWAGLTAEEIKHIGGAKAVETFIRAYHVLPDRAIIRNNPLLGERPWPRLFNIMKSRLLMMGQGHKIYDGASYYNSINDRMVIEGTLSEKFVSGFAGFLKTQNVKDRPRFKNNFLTFVDSTKGLKNLNATEKQLIESLNQ